MRVIICGSRYWTDEKTIEKYILTLPPKSVIIQGLARGADLIAANIASKHGHSVCCFPAKWDLYGDAAGPIRNERMLREGKPDKIIAFHNDIKSSRGTADMLRQAKKAGIPTEIRCSAH